MSSVICICPRVLFAHSDMKTLLLQSSSADCRLVATLPFDMHRLILLWALRVQAYFSRCSFLQFCSGGRSVLLLFLRCHSEGSRSPTRSSHFFSAIWSSLLFRYGLDVQAFLSLGLCHRISHILRVRARAIDSYFVALIRLCSSPIWRSACGCGAYNQL